MDQFAYYVFRCNGAGLPQIARHCGSLRGAKESIEEVTAVDRYEEDGDRVFAVCDGLRVFQVHCVRLG